jgi:hypothetical protein
VSSDADALKALETLRSWFASPASTESDFMDSAESEAGQRAVRLAVKRGDLEGFRPGKRLLVRRVAHTAWIESHRVAPKEKAPVPKNLLDRLGSRRAANG